MIHDAADLMIGVGQETGVHLHPSDVEAAPFVWDFGPRLDPCRTRCQHRIGWDDPHLNLPRVCALTPDIPPVVELAAVGSYPLLRDMVRYVHRSRAEIGEERPIRLCVVYVIDPLDGPVGQILGQVVPVDVGSRWLDKVVVVNEVWCVLIGLGAHEPVEALETSAERPPAPGRTQAGFLPRSEVPLAERERRVSLVAQNLAEEARPLCDLGVVAGVASALIGDPAHGRRVMVAAREQACPRRRAHRSCVEVPVPQPVCGKRVHCRCGDVRAIAAELRVSDIVEHDEDHIRRAVRRSKWRRVRRNRVSVSSPDVSRKRISLFVLERHSRFLPRRRLSHATRRKASDLVNHQSDGQ